MRGWRWVIGLLAVLATLAVGGCGKPSVTIPPPTPVATPVPGVGAMIPSDDGFESFEVFGIVGKEALATATSITPQDLDAVLSSHARTAADFSYGIGTGSKGTVVAAFQIKGLTASSFAELIPEASTATVKKTKVGGKEVLASEAAGTGSWVYMPNDMIFVITGSQDAAAALLKKLP